MAEVCVTFAYICIYCASPISLALSFLHALTTQCRISSFSSYLFFHTRQSTTRFVHSTQLPTHPHCFHTFPHQALLLSVPSRRNLTTATLPLPSFCFCHFLYCSFCASFRQFLLLRFQASFFLFFQGFPS